MHWNRFVFPRAYALAAASLTFASFAFLVVPAGAQTVGDLGKEITNITSSVNKKKQELDRLTNKAEEFRKSILEKKSESASLEEQIALFDNRIARTQLDIDIAKDEVRSLELEMQRIDISITATEERMVRDRAMLGALARRLYQAQFHNDPIDILLTKKTFAEYFDAVRAVAELQEGVKTTLASVAASRAELSEERNLREAKRLAVETRKSELEVAKREIEDERALKDAVLAETRNSEMEYRYLLAELKHEQSEADSEISALEKSLREKMNLADRLKSDGSSVLSWPVSPARGITTRFHDPEYPFRNVYEHPGLDIRAYQATPVRAASSGVVARAKNAGMGYSYVMVIHAGNISTVYGHLSKVLAKEDSYVERGEIVGYSGGMPGTPGAGTMTTGPHLHFETRLNGIPIDPMRYLVAL